MSEKFDPYYTWLGIPPKDQPPNYYRLLGLELFETNADVIENAADRQMSHLRTFSTGKHTQQSQELLNLVSRAKVCLLNAEKRSAYDQQLRGQSPSPAPPPAPGPRRALRKAKAESPAPPSVVAAPVSVRTGPAPAVASSGVSSAASRLRSSRRPGWVMPACLGGGGALLALVLLVTLSKRDDPPTDNVPVGNTGDTTQQPGDATVATGADPQPGVTPGPKPANGSNVQSENLVGAPQVTTHQAVDPGTSVSQTNVVIGESPPPRYALRCAGQSNVALLNTGHLIDTPTGFTVEAWVRLLSSSRPKIIFSTLDGQSQASASPPQPTAGWQLGLYPHAMDQSHFGYVIVSRETKLTLGSSSPSVKFYDGRWRHIAICVSAESAELFLDGQSVYRRIRMALPVSSPGPLTVGPTRYMAADALWGDLCGLRLSSGRRYRATFEPSADMTFANDATTLALLDFSRQGPNGVVSDVSGHQRHGKIAGAQWVEVSASLPGVTPGATGVVENPQSPAPGPQEEPKPQPEPKRAAAPSKEQIAEARKRIREIFASDIKAAKEPQQLVALAEKLAQSAEETRGDPASRYTLYLEARDMAARAVASDSALRFAETLASLYDIDAWRLKSETMAALIKAARFSQDRRQVAEAAMRVAEDSVIDDRYDVAETLLNDAAALAVKARNNPLAKQARLRLKELEVDLARWKVAQKARVTLSQTADDPAANLVLGKYLCFARGEWSQGLPLLAKSDSAALKTLAEQEAQAPASPQQRMKLADAWYVVGQDEKADASEKNGALVRALHWYQSASAGLTGLDKAAADKRAKELAESTQPVGAKGGGADLPWLGEEPGEVRVLRGHTAGINGLSVSASGKMAASSSEDGTVRLWDLTTGQQIRLFPNNVNQFKTVAISPDEQFVFAGTRRANGVFVWNAKTGEPVKQLPSPDDIRRIVLSPDGKLLVWMAGDSDRRNVGVIQLRTQKAAVIDVPDFIRDVAISSDGRFVATVGQDRFVRVWDLRTGRQVEQYTGHSSTISCVAFSPDGKSIASGCYDQTMRIWDRPTGRQSHVYHANSNSISDVCFSADGRQVLLANSTNGVVVYDLQQQRVLEMARSSTGGFTRCVCALPDARGVVFGNSDGSIYLWRLQDNNPQAEANTSAPSLPPRPPRSTPRPSAPAASVPQTPPPGEKPANTGAASVDRDVMLWAVRNGWEVDARTADGRVRRIKKTGEAPLENFSITALFMQTDPQNVTDAQLRQLAELESLERVVFNASLTDDFAARLPDLTRVKYVTFADCTQITEKAMTGINRWSGLTSVYISGSQTAVAAFTKLSNQSITRFSCRDIPLHDDDVVALVRRLPHLADLHFVGVPVSVKALDSLATLRQLTALGLSKTAISSESLKSIAKMDGLRTLYLTSTKIDAKYLDTITHLELFKLSLHGVPLNEQCLPALAKFKKLRYLAIVGTGLSPADVRELRTSLPKCSIVGDPARK